MNSFHIQKFRPSTHFHHESCLEKSKYDNTNPFLFPLSLWGRGSEGADETSAAHN